MNRNDYVVGGDGNDADYGRVDAVDGDRCLVRWFGSLARTWSPVGDLLRCETRAEAEREFQRRYRPTP